MVILVIDGDSEVAHSLAVDAHLCRHGSTGSDAHRELPRRGAFRMGQHDGLTAACRHSRGVKEVAAARIPTVAVDLMQTVIVVGRGIEAIDKCCRVDGGNDRVVLGQEIIAIVGIRVARAARGIVTAPAHWTFGIEQPMAVDGTCSHLMQVVGFSKFVTIKHLILQVTAIAIDMHAAQVRESCLSYQALREFIHAGGRHPDLGPCRFAKQNGERNASKLGDRSFLKLGVRS